MFQMPTFELPSMVFTALGAMLVWARLGPEKVRVFALSRLVEGLRISDTAKLLTEFCIFVTLGVVVGVAVVQPTTVTQALAAGMGWTGLLSQPAPN